MLPNIIIYSLINGLPINLVEGKNLYDIVYIDDIVSAFIAIAFLGENKEAYYVGHNDSRTFQDIVTDIKNIINPSAKLNFGVYKEDNHLDYSFINRSLLTKDTGWIPKADFKESILKAANWIKESGIKFVG